MTTRNFAVTAAVVGASVLAVTGITYASADGSTQAAPPVQKAAPSESSVPKAAPPVQKAAPSVPKSVPSAPKGDPAGTLPDGGNGYGNGGGGRDNGGRDDGGSDYGGRDDGGSDYGGRDDEGRDDGGRGYGGRDRGYGRGDEGRIQFNDRTYSAASEGCITAASGLGSTSFSISNDSWKTVQVYRGSTCDNGAPVATVGPHGATHGVVTPTVEGGLFANDATVGSFLVMGDRYDSW